MLRLLLRLGFGFSETCVEHNFEALFAHVHIQYAIPLRYIQCIELERRINSFRQDSSSLSQLETMRVLLCVTQ